MSADSGNAELLNSDLQDQRHAQMLACGRMMLCPDGICPISDKANLTG